MNELLFSVFSQDFFFFTASEIRHCLEMPKILSNVVRAKRKHTEEEDYSK